MTNWSGLRSKFEHLSPVWIVVIIVLTISSFIITFSSSEDLLQLLTSNSFQPVYITFGIILMLLSFFHIRRKYLSLTKWIPPKKRLFWILSIVIGGTSFLFMEFVTLQVIINSLATKAFEIVPKEGFEFWKNVDYVYAFLAVPLIHWLYFRNLKKSF